MEEQCVKCDIIWLFNPSLEEPNVCMVCGEALCAQCYDESPYCPDCESNPAKGLTRSGECVECGRFSSLLSVNGSCEGCVMQAAIDAQQP